MNQNAAQEKENILTRLLDAVKQCQIRFGGKTELATELDSRVCCLCAAWEAALSHGLKHTNKALSTLKQVTEITGLTRISSTPGLSILGEIKNIETEPAFWHCIKEVLSDHERQRYSLLKRVTTDEGKGRAWLRSAMNEHSLEKYLHMLIEDKVVLPKHFEEWSLMRDIEKVNMLPNMAGGLGSILFAISTDNEDLNCIRPATGLDAIISSTPPVSSSYNPRVDDEPRPVIAADGSPQAERKKKKKKLKKPVKIVSFDEGESSVSASPASSVASSVVTSPRTTSSGVDFTSVASIISTGASHRGFIPRQGSSDSQSSQSSTSRTRPHILQQHSADTAAPARVTPSLGKIGKSATTGTSGPVENDTAGMKTTDVSSHISNAVFDSVVNTTDAATKSFEDISVNPFSNPFADDLKPTEKSIASNNGSRESPASSNINVQHASKRRIPSQSSVDSLSSNTVPDIVSLSLDTPLTLEKEGDETTTNVIKVAVQTEAFKSEAPVSRETESVTNNTAAYIEQLLNPGRIETATIAEEDEGLERGSQSNSDNTSIHSTSSAQTPTQSSSMPKVANGTLSQGKPQHKRTPSIVSNTSNVSAASESSAQSYSEIPSNLTPLGPEGIIAESKRTSSFCGSEDISVDSSDVQNTGYNDMTYSAAVALAMAQEGLRKSDNYSYLRTQGDGSNAPDPAVNSSDSLTTEELKQAVIAMMVRKDEAEEQNRHIRAMFETEIEVSNALRTELDESKKSHLTKQERDADKARVLSRENELLKHQLKKYVNAVQMLRRQGAKAEDLPGIHVDEDPQPPIPPPISAIDYSAEASEYEQKLVQVAEMHGELMEFNELLHKQMVAKDFLINRLKQELVGLRGPLPEDIQVPDDDVSIVSNRSEYSLSRALVHVWIPSAFLRGTGSDGFHVYQVYIRIKDEEWNVYRRYAEFNDLHNNLKKKYSIVTSFEFPKKKAIGNKDPKFVEERRKKLQVYIRNVTNLLSQSDPILAASPCKLNLLEVAPFFGDVIRANQKGKGRGKNRTRQSGGGAVSAASPSPSSSEQQYMGL